MHHLWRKIIASFIRISLILLAFGCSQYAWAAPPTIDGCQIYPADNIWNTPVDQLPLDPHSATYINSIGAGNHVHADFGTGTIGIPFVSVPGTEPLLNINFTLYGDESDPGPYPVPVSAPVEGGPDSDGDRHVLGVDHDNCVLYEMYRAFPNASDWDAGCGAVYDLNVNGPLRTDGFTSADAAGLPILPGLVRYEEVAAGAVTHAIRFTAPRTQNVHIWPARHDAGSSNSAYPPMGARLRLRSNYDISGFSADVQVILQALKTYGMILADNGSAWFLTGAPNDSWDNDMLHEMDVVLGSDFQVVDTSVVMVDPNSGQAGTWPPPPIFSDDFEDNDVTDWASLLGTWTASAGNMTGTSIKKADNFPNAFLPGCVNCMIEADLQVISPGATISLLGWYVDKKNYVELQILDKKDKVVLKKYSTSGKSKQATRLTITPGVNYHVRIRYTPDGVVAEIPGLSQPLVVNSSAVSTGTVGFRVKSTTGTPATGSFAAIIVY